MDISVEDVPDEERFEARTADGVLAGFAAYQLASNLIVMTHTEVDPAFEGQGVATALIRGALDDIRERRIPMLPLCPFVVAFLQRHPDYRDLVYTAPQPPVND
jgi:predicted GNAT family acetyltransferase